VSAEFLARRSGLLEIDARLLFFHCALGAAHVLNNRALQQGRLSAYLSVKRLQNIVRAPRASN